MNSYFLDANGDYYETVLPAETPAGHTAVSRRPEWWSEWVNGAWVTPNLPVPVPQSISKVQFVRAARAAGLWDAYKTAIESHADWPYVTQIPRTDPMVTAMADGLGFTDAQLDALWVSGASL